MCGYKFPESSIVYGYTSAFLRKLVRKITSPKITKNTSATSRAQFYERKTRNSIFWKFLGNYMMEISWKLYDGNFLELYAGNFRWMLEVLDGGYYGTML